MASPQTENGFTRIANEILEELARVNLSPYESRIYWFVLRRTYGFNKKMDRISLSQFETGTGIKDRHVVRSIKSLVKKQMLLTHKDGPQSVTYGVQKDYERWLKPLPLQGVPVEGVPLQGVPGEGETSTSTGSETSTSTGRHNRQKTITKERVRAEKRTPASRAAKEVDPAVKQFVDFWHQKYLDRFKDKYMFTGKDGVLVKRLLGSYQVDRLKSLAISFFETGDSWIKTNGGYTIGVFNSQINKIVSTAKASQARPLKEMPL